METASIAADVTTSSAYKILNQFTNGPIAACEHHGRFAMVYRDDRNDSFWVTDTPDGMNWSKPTQIENQQLYDAAAMASFKGSLYIVYKDDNNSRLWVTHGQPGVSKWSVSRLGEQLSDGPICLATDGSRLHLIYQDDKNYANWYSYFDGHSWSKPVIAIQQQQMAVGGGNAGMVVHNGRLFVVYRDAKNDRMWSTSQDSHGNFQSPAVIIDQYTKGPLTLTCVGETLYLVYGDNVKSKIWVTKSTDGQRWSKAHELDNQQMKYAAAVAPLTQKTREVWLAYRDEKKTQLWSTRID